MNKSQESSRTQWFEDESLWIDAYDFMFPPSRIAAAEVEVEPLLRLVGGEPQAVLDLCCGPGRFAVPLARRGLRVTGVDRTKFFLAKAQERAAAEDVQVEWVHDDMRTFVRPEAFDLALSMFTSFGYFDDKTEDSTVLRNIHTSLRPGGVLVMDVVGKELLARDFEPTHSRKHQDGTVVIDRREVYDDWTRVRMEWTIIKGDAVRVFTIDHTVYSGQELKDRFIAAGLRDVRLYGGMDGSAYDREAERLIAVGRKPGP